MTLQEIEIKAKKMVDMGAKMTFEQIVEMYIKKEAKKNKRSSKKWSSRKSVSATVKQRENEQKNISDVDFQNWDEQQRKNQMNLLK